MLQFTAILSKKDLQAFFITKMEIFHPRNFLALALYGVPIVILVVLLLNQTVSATLLLLALAGVLSLFSYTIYRIAKALQNSLATHQGIIGKERRFYLTPSTLKIYCRDPKWSGEYALQELQKIEENKRDWILIFSPNIHILIPKDALNAPEEKQFLQALESLVNPASAQETD